jgi:hypothetical protein
LPSDAGSPAHSGAETASPGRDDPCFPGVWHWPAGCTPGQRREEASGAMIVWAVGCQVGSRTEGERPAARGRDPRSPSPRSPQGGYSIH